MRLAFLTSVHPRCGIARYGECLVRALRALPDAPEIEVVPAGFERRAAEEDRALQEALNRGDVASIQFTYALFGGMHPLRSTWRRLVSRVRQPLLLTVHELDLRATGRRGMPAPAEVAYKRRFNRTAMLHPAVRGWLVHSPDLRDALVELGAPRERVHFRPLPFEAPAAPADPTPLRRRLGWEGRRALVIPGFLARRKGYETALRALALLPSEYFLLAAGGPHPADPEDLTGELVGRAEELGVGDRFRVTGPLSEEEMEQAVALAEVVLAPYTEISASAALNYALARGKAVAASDLPVLRETPGLARFPAGDPAALAGVVREMESPALRERLRSEARDYVARHSYERLAQDLRALYGELARGA